MPLNHPHCAGLSHVGRARETNEDQYLIADLSKSMTVHSTTLSIEDETRLFSDVQGQLLLVADGVGSHAVGEVASELTANTIAQHVLHTMPWYLRLHHDHDHDLEEELKAAVMKCEQVVDAEAETHRSEYGMGTTLTMAYFIWPRMFIVHVGDSRCYLLRDGIMEQLTRDHTMAQEFVDEGALSPEVAYTSQWSRMLLSSIGKGEEALHPDVYKSVLRHGDVVVLCTDGLTQHLRDLEIAEIISENTSERAACQALVDAANEAGGKDNITVVLSRFAQD